jgi:hypothetical protein
MTKIGLGGCVGAWVLLVAGCASSDVAGFLLMQGSGDDRVVIGSLDEVAKSTQGTLERLHLKAEVTKQGEAFYINSALENGTRFRLVLTQDKNGGTEQTHVKLEWVDKGNDQLTLHILSLVEKAR